MQHSIRSIARFLGTDTQYKGLLKNPKKIISTHYLIKCMSPPLIYSGLNAAVTIFNEEEIVAGDIVKVELDLEVFKMMQEAAGLRSDGIKVSLSLAHNCVHVSVLTVSIAAVELPPLASKEDECNTDLTTCIDLLTFRGTLSLKDCVGQVLAAVHTRVSLPCIWNHSFVLSLPPNCNGRVYARDCFRVLSRPYGCDGPGQGWGP